MNLNNSLSVASGGGSVLNVDAGGVHCRRKIDGGTDLAKTWTIDADGNATFNTIKIGNTKINADGTIENGGWRIENNGDITFTKTGQGLKLTSKNGATFRLIGSCGEGCSSITDGIGLYSYNPDGGYRSNPANWRP